jgi:dipeptidyl aminopeptidase/acylaminoacyl peptidase
MVEPYLIHYPSRDGKWTISAFLYVPFNMARNGQNAAIVYIHGGPTAQSMNSFNRFMQYAVNQGYMVLAPNYRGSTGYGKEFQQANLFDMGGGDLQDVLAGVDWIKQTGHLDPKKIAVMGGSYGGYLSMMAVTKAPDVWAAGVPIVPFVNWFTEIENEDPVLQQSDLATMGDVAKNKALYEDRSPSTSSIRSRRRCCCSREGMIRAAQNRKRSKWSTRSGSAAARWTRRFTKTKGTVSRA